MPNITLSIPEELHKKMKKHEDLKWSQIAREAFEKRMGDLDKLEWMNKILEDSKLTEKDAEEIGHKIKKEIAKKYGLAK